MSDQGGREDTAGSVSEVRRHARDVALSATLVALAVYLAAAGTADFVVVGHLQTTVDGRLAARLVQIVKSVPSNETPAAPPSVPLDERDLAAPANSGDLDDAPIFVWWIPTGRHAVALESSAPSFPADRAGVSSPTEATIAGRPFRLSGTAITGGRVVVATSTKQLIDLRNTLLIAEGSLLPVMLLTFFFIATLIGRRAATPIERARQRQLDFTADASHELRTPLSVIEAEVGLALSAQRSGPAYRAALERIALESNRLRGIVNDLLWLARLDALPDAPSSERVDLATLVESCASRFRSIAQGRRVDLVVQSPRGDEAPTVNAPAEWLDRLVSVLVDNACRYTNDGGRVVVSTEFAEGRASLTVDDSGPGISEEDEREIFRRFHRANASPGGAGIGSTTR